MSSMQFLQAVTWMYLQQNGVKISPLLTKHFYSTKFNKRVKIVQQTELKL